MNRTILVILAFLVQLSLAFSQTKIIDMHIHSYSQSDFGEREPSSDYYGMQGAANAEVHRVETFAAFEKWNILKAMLSGNPESVEEWAAKDSNNRVIKGVLVFSPDDYGLDSVKFDQMVWPYAIEKSINFLNSLDFLTEQDKEDIFYNNAVRFLKLKD